MRLPYQWQPKIISTHLAFVGNFIIAGVPGEFTTMSGRRLRDSIRSAMVENVSYQNAKVVIAGLTNTYSDYITTPEEYQVNPLIDFTKIQFVSPVKVFFSRLNDKCAF